MKLHGCLDAGRCVYVSEADRLLFSLLQLSGIYNTIALGGLGGSGVNDGGIGQGSRDEGGSEPAA